MVVDYSCPVKMGFNGNPVTPRWDMSRAVRVSGLAEHQIPRPEGVRKNHDSYTGVVGFIFYPAQSWLVFSFDMAGGRKFDHQDQIIEHENRTAPEKPHFYWLGQTKGQFAFTSSRLSMVNCRLSKGQVKKLFEIVGPWNGEGSSLSAALQPKTLPGTIRIFNDDVYQIWIPV